MSTAPLIVCFGDSLTAGFQSPSPDNPEGVATPYGQFLQARLEGRADVRIKGVCGELTAGMVKRFQRDVLNGKPSATVILGGTNDLGWEYSCSRIMDNLRNLYCAARDAGVLPVAVTVPSLRGCDDAIAPCHELNALILNHCAARDIPCVDLFAATAEPDTCRLAAAYSNDGLHLTTAGYALLATLLYEWVFKDL